MLAAASRAEALASLDGRRFDAVIVGGGINGAGVARDAALRGLDVCLLEKGDFASGTSSKSTKIAHGGLRYLKQMEFGLVFESQRERRTLRRLLPHLVTPQSFCYPVYEGDPDPLWRVRLGLTVYDLLAAFGNVRNHRALSPGQTLAANPGLRREGLKGAVRFWDHRMDDARIVLENVLSAERAGAVCLNYVEAVDIKRERAGYRVRYRQTLPETYLAAATAANAGKTSLEGSISAAAVVNCGGPWAEGVAALAATSARPRLAPTKGVHIVVPRLPLEDALILPAPGERVFFVIPWDGFSLIGTTDTRFQGSPDAVAVEAGDIDYLLSATGGYLPGLSVTRDSITYAFAGLRPLVAPGREGLPEGKISRRHLVTVEPPAFLTLAGGKFTTYRRMAEETVDRLLKALARARRPSPTGRAPFFPPAFRRAPADRGLWSDLAGYGPRAGEVFDLCLTDARLAAFAVEGSRVRLGQLLFALRAEKAQTLADLLYRRTRLCWEPSLDAGAARGLVEALAPFEPRWAAAARAEADITIARGGLSVKPW